MRGILPDLRHALRLYRQTPGASLIAVAVLAIAMAFVGAFLSLYVDLVLRPHPGFERSSRLATIGQDNGSILLGIPYGVVDRIAEEMTTIEAAALLSRTRTLIGRDGDVAVTAMVSDRFFSGLRPRLALGRGLREEDHAPDAEPVVVLSYRYWQQRFDGDRNVLGDFVEITRDPSRPYQGPNFFEAVEPEQESAQFRIVGVTAETLTVFPSFEPQIWVSLERAYPMFIGVPELLPRHMGSTYVRRAPGVHATAVAGELRARYDDADTFPGRIPGTRLDAIDGIVSNIAVQREAKRQLEMFLAGSVLLALVAAANVSLFLLSRAPGRRRELGIRMAVGAPLKRLARQLATEAALLVIVSAVLGLLGSVWLGVYLRSLAFMRDAEWRNVTLLDWRVLGLAGALLLVLTALVSLAPIVGLKRLGIAASSHHVSARASPAQRLASTAQFAVAGMLGGAAIAFGWHLAGLMFGDPGYETAERYMVERLADAVPGMTQAYTVELDRRRNVIEAIPGVTAAAFGTPVPGGDRARSFFPFPARVPDPRDPSNVVEVHSGSLDERFIDLLGLDLVHGRGPRPNEPGVVVVNQSLARMFWGRENVVGERLQYCGDGGAEIVGVLEDLSFEHPSAAMRPFVFSSLNCPAGLLAAVIETRMTAAELKQALDGLVASGELEGEVGDVHALAAIRNDLIAADRARGLLTMATAAIVVLLAAMGFYGTQRYLAAAGRREYAILASLGAGPRALGRLVFARGLLLGLPGIVVGGLLAFIAAAWLRGDFVSREIAPGPVSVSVLAGLVVLLLLATMGPARQVRSTEPAPLLRED